MNQNTLLLDRTGNAVWREILTYISLTLALAWSCQAAALFLGVNFNQLEANPPVVWLLLMASSWSPGLAALATRFLYQRSLRGMGWGRGRLRFLIPGLVLPLLYIFLTYGAIWLFNPATFTPAQVLPQANEMLGPGWSSNGLMLFTYSLLTVAMLFIPIGFFALGEEIGWSGFLMPQLAGITSFCPTALITGSLWALYHYPLMLFATGYTQGTPVWYGVVMNTAVLIVLAFTTAWLRLHSGSIWPVILCHTLWNILIFNICEPITLATPLSQYITGEKGALTALIVGIFAVLFWRLSYRKGEKEVNL